VLALNIIGYISTFESLRQFDVLDTLPEEALDDLTALAATICEVFRSCAMPPASVPMLSMRGGTALRDMAWLRSGRGFTSNSSHAAPVLGFLRTLPELDGAIHYLSVFFQPAVTLDLSPPCRD
jgi:hypothetical protein